MASTLEFSFGRVTRSIVWGHRQTLLDFEKGHRIPRGRTMQAIARAIEHRHKLLPFVGGPWQKTRPTGSSYEVLFVLCLQRPNVRSSA